MLKNYAIIGQMHRLGIYSAGLKQKDIDQITFAGVQSVRKAALLGHIDLIIVDEAHTINHNDTGGYRELIDDLTAYQSKVQGHRFDRLALTD